jgi:hypothetical protein
VIIETSWNDFLSHGLEEKDEEEEEEEAVFLT